MPKDQKLGLSTAQTFTLPKVLIMDLANTPRDLKELNINDKDLTMFTLTQLRLEKQEQVIQIVCQVKWGGQERMPGG